MCRAGGRRCPAYSDPAKTAERNARRRAAYAKSKGKAPAVHAKSQSESLANSTSSTTVSEKLSEVLEGVVFEKPSTLAEKEKEAMNAKNNLSNMIIEVEQDSAVELDEKNKNNITAQENLLNILAEVTAENEAKKAEEKAKHTSSKESGGVTFDKDSPFSADPYASDNDLYKQVFEGTKFNLLHNNVNQQVQDDEAFTTSIITEYKPELNIEVRENSGLLADMGYFNKQTVSGVLDYTNIDGSSEMAEKLGFRKLEEGDTYAVTENTKMELDDFVTMGDEETKNYDEDENEAITGFSVASYEWLNEALFNKKVAADDNEEPGNFSEAFEAADYNRDDRTFNNISTVVGVMDEALAKGPKKQRTLYRSVPGYANMLRDSNGKKMTASDWAKSMYAPGKEVVFDGYQSTSPKANAVGSFLSNSGLMYEIITPEGVNISSKSSFKKEQEVTLPRSARYTVVSVVDQVNVEGKNKTIFENVTVVRLMAINSKGEILDGTNSDPIEPMKKEDYEQKKANSW